jgi:DNA-binding MarR family transcriptional regulator
MTATQDGTTGVSAERRLGQRVHAFSNMVSASYYQRTEKPFGVALAEWRVLRSTIIAPGISQGEIATAEGLNVMTVSRAVASLRRKGLLEARPDPEDRRRSLLSPTDLGRRVGVDIGAREQTVYEHVFSVLSGDELVLLDELLHRVNTKLREEDLPPPPPASEPWGELIAKQRRRAEHDAD